MDETLRASATTDMRKVLESELRTLRLNRGRMCEAGLARASHLCELLGAGNPAQTRIVLTGLLDELPAVPSLLALAYSLGIKSSKPTHKGRLRAYANARDCTERTARRASDEGANVLARRIVERLNPLALVANQWGPPAIPAVEPESDGLPLVQGHHVTVPVPDGATNLSLTFSVERPLKGGIAVTLHLGDEWLNARTENADTPHHQ